MFVQALFNARLMDMIMIPFFFFFFTYSRCLRHFMSLSQINKWRQMYFIRSKSRHIHLYLKKIEKWNRYMLEHTNIILSFLILYSCIIHIQPSNYDCSRFFFSSFIFFFYILRNHLERERCFLVYVSFSSTNCDELMHWAIQWMMIIAPLKHKIHLFYIRS